MLVITTWNKEQPAPSMLVLRVAGYSAYKSASCRLVCDRKTAQPVDVGSDLNLTTLTLSTAVEIPLYFQDERRGYYPAAGPAAGSFWEVPQCSHFNIQSDHQIWLVDISVDITVWHPMQEPAWGGPQLTWSSAVAARGRLAGTGKTRV